MKWYYQNAKRMSSKVLGLILVIFVCTNCIKDDIPVVVIKTYEATNVTSNSATIEGEIISDGGETITQMGVCISTKKQPTLVDGHAFSNSNNNSTKFSVQLANLEPSKKYYYRTFVIGNITHYGEEKSFNTLYSYPVLVTHQPTVNNLNSSLLSGMVLYDGGASITERGFCWSTNPNPTIDDNIISCGTGIGKYSCIINELQTNVKYYVRSFATNAYGTGYGETKTLWLPWVKKANFLGGYREHAVSFNIFDRGYIGTGSNLKDFWEFNPTTNTWTQKASIGENGRDGAFGFSINGKGYIGYGQSWELGALHDFWEFNPLTNSWSQVASFGTFDVVFAVSFAIGNKGYVGWDYRSLSEYNPEQNKWSQKSNVPEIDFSEATGFSVSNKGYFLTGYPQNKFWEYNPSTNTWVEKTEIDDGWRQGAVGFSINGMGYVGLGYSVDWGKDGVIYKKDFWKYNPLSDSWTLIGNFVSARSDAKCFTIGDKGYIGLGKNDSEGFDDFWEFVPEPESE